MANKILTLSVSGDSFIADTVSVPTIAAASCTVSGSDTASNNWTVATPAATAGDLLLFYIAWDDSTSTTSVSANNGPNAEILTVINPTPVTDTNTETRAQAWYTKAAAAWTAGTVRFTPNANESWSSSVVRVSAGDFDFTTPIGATAISGASSVTQSAVLSPSFTAGSTDGGGKIVWFAGADTDPFSVTASQGWSFLQTQDLGAVTHAVAVRDASAGTSESVAQGTLTIASDSWTSVAFVVRKASASPFRLASRAAINGIDSAQGEATGWDALKGTIAVTSLVRTASAVATLTIPSLSTYNITGNEVLTWGVPGSILVGGVSITATPTFTISAASAAALTVTGVAQKVHHYKQLGVM